MASVCQSLQCLISALTQVGGGGILFRFASSVVLWGRWGARFSPSMLLRLPAALYGAGPVLSAVPVFGYSTKAQIWLPPAFCAFPGLSGSGSQRLGRPLLGCGAPFFSAASHSGSQRLGHTLPGCSAPFHSVAPARAAGRVPAACLCSEELASSLDPPGVGFSGIL